MQAARINKTSCCKLFLKTRGFILRPYGSHLMSSVLIRVQGCSLVSLCCYSAAQSERFWVCSVPFQGIDSIVDVGKRTECGCSRRSFVCVLELQSSPAAEGPTRAKARRAHRACLWQKTTCCLSFLHRTDNHAGAFTKLLGRHLMCCMFTLIHRVSENHQRSATLSFLNILFHLFSFFFLHVFCRWS